MIKVNEIINLVRSKIKSDHDTGDQIGGSGHFSYSTFRLNSIHIKIESKDRRYITYRYDVYVETEFTYYPDNPPREYNYCKKIILNRNNRIIETKDITVFDTELEAWIGEQDRISDYIEKYLHKLEWKYGSNRAPFKFPPIYICIEDINVQFFICVFETDLGDEEPYLMIESKVLSDLYNQVCHVIEKRFNS